VGCPFRPVPKGTGQSPVPTENEIDFLVMEYLEGETVAQRLLKGPMPLDQVLRYAMEISDALDKAHRKGVTHRDVKPGNIMLTSDGSKLLDFGLAKLKEEAQGRARPQAAVLDSEAPTPPPAGILPSQLPTPAPGKEPLSLPGQILGTIQYMAPEQVEGKMDDIDGRTDIFSFGATVYEMTTGCKAFQGKSQVSLMAAILEHDPPSITSLQPMTPPALDRAVKKCLAKNKEERWQTANVFSS